jgi:hypothetical protein
MNSLNFNMLIQIWLLLKFLIGLFLRNRMFSFIDFSLFLILIRFLIDKGFPKVEFYLFTRHFYSIFIYFLHFLHEIWIIIHFLGLFNFNLYLSLILVQGRNVLLFIWSSIARLRFHSKEELLGMGTDLSAVSCLNVLLDLFPIFAKQLKT